MTNDELRIAIAKAKGMNAGVVEEWDDIYGTHHTHDYAGDRNWYPAGTPIHYAENGVFYPLPDWPNDIAAAWELVEEMITPKDESIAAILASHRPYIVWNGEDWIYLVGGDESDEQVARGTTLPLAISRAWLIWKTEAE